MVHIRAPTNFEFSQRDSPSSTQAFRSASLSTYKAILLDPVDSFACPLGNFGFRATWLTICSANHLRLCESCERDPFEPRWEARHTEISNTTRLPAKIYLTRLASIFFLSDEDCEIVMR